MGPLGGLFASVPLALPEGEGSPRLWLVATEPGAQGAAAELARQIHRIEPEAQLALCLVGRAEAPADPTPPPGTLQRLDEVPGAGPVSRFLRRWRPDLIVLLGHALPDTLIGEAQAAGVPLALADARISLPQKPSRRRRPAGSAGELAGRVTGTAAGPAIVPQGSLLRGPRQSRTATLLGRIGRFWLRDAASASALQALGIAPERIAHPGTITDAPEPLSCTEAERAALAELLRARPVWLAAGLPAAELDWVLRAHLNGLRHAHRLLLILVPADPAEAETLADHCAAEGLAVARRARDEEPEEDIQVLVAGDQVEMGLWYRLAPLCWMGGTGRGAGSTRAPFEAAALGSAIIHGPRVDPYAGQYARLAAARAMRLVAGPAALADAVTDLLAPDKAALLAHNAWASCCAGAGVAQRVAEDVLDHVDALHAVPPRPRGGAG
ncbi:3-deoxy-D-manno-octulosonic acid transferase [Phaeovulum vinaykumarii]|uniref:3-deoxy-D-manno-octulosonic acid transferase n=1 Tax=Phaeovulum vinaykumarii TaxID=407234 RepID=A0A1N7L098_9RHOB|nr:glycosyltransferase N-terminal domain-containing protein [Phaeovulum vinaykumarii]SIS67258.1 3-deoxy-D-manno-octulosonic-acid transferase [Phaeovulum vinaykumarii]SOC00786.1 3-deoxy-D-manno-octulosonic-acid transferase [Phaeovulum vinaykumarii]